MPIIMFIKNLNQREKNILIVCVVVAFGAAVYVMVIEPAATYWKTQNGELEAKIGQFEKDKRILNTYKKFGSEYSRYQDFVVSSSGEEEESRKVLGEIERISKESSCYVSNVKPQMSKKIDRYKEIFFEITTEGNIGQITKFLYSVETSTERLRVKRFTIIPKSGGATLKGTFIISKLIAPRS